MVGGVGKNEREKGEGDDAEYVASMLRGRVVCAVRACIAARCEEGESAAIPGMPLRGYPRLLNRAAAR